MHRLRWDDLQFIHAVVEQGSLSGAARVLGVNHATVHRRLGALEDRHGVSLFDRLPGGYRLRPEARDLLEALETIDHEARRVERSFRGVRRSIEGSFRLTTTDTIAAMLLPKHLARLRQVHPEVQLELTITNQRIDMAQPLAEIAIRPIRVLPDDMSGEQFGDLQFRVFGAYAYLAANPSADVAAHNWLGVTPSISRSPAGIWQGENLGDTPPLSADSFFPLAACAAAGMGLAMLPVFVGRNWPGLFPAPQFTEIPTIPFWVATHRDLRRMEPINALIEFFADALRDDSELTPEPAPSGP